MSDTTVVGRALFEHPNLGHEGGSDLHGHMATMFTNTSNHLAARFFTQDALANGASVEFTHSFKCRFTDLYAMLYIRDTGTGELTRVVKDGTPDLDDFVIVATPSFLTTKIRVTNNTGSARDIALVVSNSDARRQSTDFVVRADGMGHFATLADALASSEVIAGSTIRVMSSETVNTTITISKNNLRIVFDPGVTFSKGSATTGISIQADGVILEYGRFTGFNGGSDKAIEITSGSDFSRLLAPRFSTNTTDVDDTPGTGSIFGSISE